RGTRFVQLLIFRFSHARAERSVLVGVIALPRVGILAVFFQLTGAWHRGNHLRAPDLGRGDRLLSHVGRIHQSPRWSAAVMLTQFFEHWRQFASIGTPVCHFNSHNHSRVSVCGKLHVVSGIVATIGHLHGACVRIGRAYTRLFTVSFF